MNEKQSDNLKFYLLFILGWFRMFNLSLKSITQYDSHCSTCDSRVHIIHYLYLNLQSRVCFFATQQCAYFRVTSA